MNERLCGYRLSESNADLLGEVLIGLRTLSRCQPGCVFGLGCRQVLGGSLVDIVFARTVPREIKVLGQMLLDTIGHDLNTVLAVLTPLMVSLPATGELDSLLTTLETVKDTAPD